MANIKNELDNIKKALYGKDVRNSIHNGIEVINQEVEKTTAKQESLEKIFEDLTINAGSSNAEIVIARTDKNTNETYKTIGDRLDMISSNINNVAEGRHLLNFKSVAGTISNSFTITDSDIKHCEKQGIDICVCPMVSVRSKTDSNIVAMDETRITEALERIKTSKVKAVMLKPHIGLNFSDNLNRKEYDPEDKELFFKNWTDILLNYADICNRYNIPILCVSVEMVVLTKNTYASKWETLYKTIKARYPALLIVHAPKSWEFTDVDVEESLQWADLLGSTFYTSYTDKVFGESDVINVDEISKAFFENERRWLKTVNERCAKYNKKFFVCEIGVMALNDGLINVVPRSYITNNKIVNYNVQAALMEAFFKHICSNPNIIGFSWWHMREPFNYYTDNIETSAEKMMIKYCKGGLI